MGEAHSERRRFPRVNVGGRTKGTVNAVHDVSLLDISLGGALIEHAQVVQPGIAFDLVLTLVGQKLKLRCRAVRSVVSRSEAQAKGGQKLIYRTGLEFLQPAAETQQVIGDYIRSIIEDEQKGGANQPDAAGPLEQGRLQPQRTPGKPARRP
ncbi:MAG: PilZ domain-containing protein [Candidatus Methylomirabilales bacterium]